MADSDLYCQYVDHENKPINSICINSTCSSLRTACFSCLKEFHKEHLDDLLDFDQFNKWTLESLKQYDILNDLIEQLQSVTLLLHSFLKQQQCTFINPSTITQLNKKVEKILQHQSIKQELFDGVKKMKESLSEFTNNFNLWSECKLQENGSKRLVQVMPERKAPQQKQQIQETDRFVNRVRFQFINMNNEQINISKSGNRVEGIGSCICQPRIPNHGVTIFAFKIVKIDWWIYIGICMNPNSIKNYQELGHGCYLISNFGCSYSNHQLEVNDKQTSFQFNKNDIIIIEVDIDKQNITWIKKETNQTFSMQINKQFEYYFFVELDGTQESIVEISEF